MNPQVICNKGTGDEFRCTWDQFVADNREAMTDDEFAFVLTTITSGKVWQDGGGAFAEFTLELDEFDPDEADRDPCPEPRNDSLMDAINRSRYWIAQAVNLRGWFTAKVDSAGHLSIEWRSRRTGETYQCISYSFLMEYEPDLIWRPVGEKSERRPF